MKKPVRKMFLACFVYENGFKKLAKEHELGDGKREQKGLTRSARLS